MTKRTRCLIAAMQLCVWAPPLHAEINIVFQIPDSERETIYFDDFDSDETGWSLDSDEDVKLKIDNGIYVIDRAKEDGNYILLQDGFDFNEDFTIEAKMRKTKGDEASIWYGLAWGHETDADYSDFLVGADGTYSLNHFRQGTYTEVLGWTSNGALETKNGWNTLCVERRAPPYTIMGEKVRFMHNYKYHFYINDQLCGSYDDWPAFFGTHLGIRMSAKVKVEVDYVKVTRP
jgi:hypothetical protein